jgi:hypothetical protein
MGDYSGRRNIYSVSSSEVRRYRCHDVANKHDESTIDPIRGLQGIPGQNARRTHQANRD